MVVSNREVKSLGFAKISSMYARVMSPEVEGASKLEVAIDHAILAFGGISISPYSMLNYWGSIKTLDVQYAGGLKTLIKTVEPLLDELVEVPESAKRKFRNTWTMLWQRYSDATSDSEDMISKYQLVGLLLPVFVSALNIGEARAVNLVGRLSAFHLLCEGIETEPNSLTFEDIDILCEFFNMVICWNYLASEQYENSEALLSALVTSNDAEFRSMLLGDR